MYSNCKLDSFSIRGRFYLFLRFQCELSWLEHGANSIKVVGSIPVKAISLRVGLNDPCGSTPTQNILGFWDQIPSHRFPLLEGKVMDCGR